jgi:uncharacterized membrane protein
VQPERRRSAAGTCTANQNRHDERIFAQRAANATSGFLGSWRHIGMRTLVIVVWV